MREFGITFIGLGLLASATSLVAPADWQLARWGMTLLMLGAPLYMLHLWARRRAERMGATWHDPRHRASEDTDP